MKILFIILSLGASAVTLLLGGCRNDDPDSATNDLFQHNSVPPGDLTVNPAELRLIEDTQELLRETIVEEVNFAEVTLEQALRNLTEFSVRKNGDAKTINFTLDVSQLHVDQAASVRQRLITLPPMEECPLGELMRYVAKMGSCVIQLEPFEVIFKPKWRASHSKNFTEKEKTP